MLVPIDELEHPYSPLTGRARDHGPSVEFTTTSPPNNAKPAGTTVCSPFTSRSTSKIFISSRSEHSGAASADEHDSNVVKTIAIANRVHGTARMSSRPRTRNARRVDENAHDGPHSRRRLHPFVLTRRSERFKSGDGLGVVDCGDGDLSVTHHRAIEVPEGILSEGGVLRVTSQEPPR